MSGSYNNPLESARKLSFVLCVLTGLLFDLKPAVANNETIRFAEKANLALRRTAHHLLIANGDSLSQIPPVRQVNSNTFSIKVDHLFDYEKLPELLKQSLKIHDITEGYNVTVLNCETGILQLGYNFQDLNRKDGVPCQDRQREEGCYDVQVSFITTPPATQSSSNWWLLPFGGALAGFWFITWKRSRSKKAPVNGSEILVPPAATGIGFGNSILDTQNQTLISDAVTYNLTYRETKLLNLFVTHTNQILERDFILKSVWEDEGVIVGRSVDVFVSRLRKFLIKDPKVKITAVHSIGYKMEVLL
jgi:hypothetical protein